MWLDMHYGEDADGFAKIEVGLYLVNILGFQLIHIHTSVWVKNKKNKKE